MAKVTKWIVASKARPAKDGYYQLYYRSTGKTSIKWGYYDISKNSWFKEISPTLEPKKNIPISCTAHDFFYWRGLFNENESWA